MGSMCSRRYPCSLILFSLLQNINTCEVGIEKLLEQCVCEMSPDGGNTLWLVEALRVVPLWCTNLTIAVSFVWIYERGIIDLVDILVYDVCQNRIDISDVI